MKNLLFIGGIHGVGKGTICKSLAKTWDLIHITASEVLKWEEISKKEEKIVKDFQFTQNRLINNLQNIMVDDKTYLLDGHYCLLNKEGIPEKIGFDTFANLQPKAFIIVTENVNIIKERLDLRDNTYYDIEILNKFQVLEFDYSLELSKTLNIPHIAVESGNFIELNLFLSNEGFTRH